MACDFVATLGLNEARDAYRVLSQIGFSPSNDAFAEHTEFPRRVFSGRLTGGEAVLVNDLSQLPAELRAALRPFGVTNLIATGLGMRGRRFGVLVADSGIGIPVRLHERIFEPFYQIDESTSVHYGGAGLGLHIVRRLVQILAGTVSVSSQVGVGSEFVVRIPLRPQGTQAAAPVEQTPTDLARVPPGTAPPPRTAARAHRSLGSGV